MSANRYGTFYSVRIDSVRLVLSIGCPLRFHFTRHTHLPFPSRMNQRRPLIFPEEIFYEVLNIHIGINFPVPQCVVTGSST